MTQQKIELSPDIILKNYWQDNEHYADFINAVLFQGADMIKAEDLHDVDSNEAYVMEHRKVLQGIQMTRDVIKVCKRSKRHKVDFVLLGMEAQEHIHYAMPMRIMGYDYASYKKQYDANARQYKKASGLTSDEYLSRMRREDKFIPVITVVVYYGEKPWDAATSLHEMLMLTDELKPFVNDYKMQLVEARNNDLHLHNINNRDLFQLLAILLNNKVQKEAIKRAAIDYARTNHVEKNVVLTAAGAAKCRLNYNEIEAKGEVDMCTVFEETWQEGVEEGIERGISRGENKLFCKMYQNGMSIQEISKATDMPEERIREAIENTK